MEEIGVVLASWQFWGVGLIVAVLMTALMKFGKALWKVQWKWLRQCLIFLDGISPWLAPLFGAGIGAIPQLPRPGFIADLSDSLGYALMIVLGLLAGAAYEKVWKGVKQIAEARGLKLDIDLPPKEQKKARAK